MNPIFPSILSTNFFDLENRLQEFRVNGIECIHLDVMDGHFVDNISFGPGTIPAIRSKFQFIFDSHLMVSNPGKMIPKYSTAGSDWISFHAETDESISDNIALIHENGCKAGLVLNPDTAIEKAFPFLDQLDYILIMSVFPGYGGQAFIPATLERVVRLRHEIRSRKSQCLIQVDGGITDQTIGPLKKAGTDLFVIGTHLFNTPDVGKTLKKIQHLINGV